MFAGHFAAGLALRGRARKVPVAAYVGGAFLLDFLWIAFGVSQVDLTAFNDWSHSLVMSIIWATAFAAIFARSGSNAVVAVWLAVFSHYVLDLLIQGGTLYPGAPQNLLIPAVATKHALALQLVISCALLIVFARDEWIADTFSWRTIAACGLVVALTAR